MCVIIASQDREHRPSAEVLAACERHNPDGSGLAWIEDGEVWYLKGMSSASIADALLSLDGPVIIHFRIASVGGVRTQLCHPFPIHKDPAAKRYGKARSVLFHNGTWSAWKEFMDLNEIELDGPMSDTRAAAACAARFGFDWLKQIPCRWAMLSVRKGIRLIGDWTEVGGCLFSNDYWLPRVKCTPKPNANGQERQQWKPGEEDWWMNWKRGQRGGSI